MVMASPAHSAGGLALLGALLWAGALLVRGGPWDPVQVVVIASGSMLLATAVLAGMVVKGSRWARRGVAGLAAGQLALATVVPISWWWWAGVAVAGAALLVGSGPWLVAIERRRPPSLGPPPRAVALICTLAGAPVVLSAVSINGIGGGWVLAVVSALAAGAYAKALAGSLLAVRFLVPAAGISAVLTTPWPGWAVAAIATCLLVWLGWHEEVRLAVRPLVDPPAPPTPGPTPLRIRSARETARGSPPAADAGPDPR